MPTDVPSNESGRVEMFTDGVFAIAITLLVLDLPVPQSGRFLTTLLDDWPSFFAYLAAFLTIASIWVHHHTVFSRIRRVEPAVILLNLLLLLGVSLLPWPTSLIAASIRDDVGSDGIVACAIYAAVALIVMIAWSALSAALSRRPHLLRSPEESTWMRMNAWEALLSGVPVIVAVGAALITPLLSLALFVAIPIYFLISTSRARGPRRASA